MTKSKKTNPSHFNGNNSEQTVSASDKGKSVESVTTDDLKARFKTRSIPLESDFANLIEVAEYGRRAVGKNPEQMNQSKYTGLELNNNGQLLIKCDEAAGVTTTVNGVSVKTGDGLETGKGKITLRLNSLSGLNLDGFGLAVKANTNKGIAVESAGVCVKANNSSGIKVDGSGVGVLANTSAGIMVDVKGIAVKANDTSGIKVDNNGLGILTNSDAGIMVDANGVGVIVDNSKGIIVNKNGIGINTSPENGLRMIDNKLSVAIDEGSGLTLTTNGIQMAPDYFVKMLLDMYSPAISYSTIFNNREKCIVLLCHGSRPDGHLFIRYYGTSTTFCGLLDEFYDAPRLVDTSGNAHRPYSMFLKESDTLGLKVLETAVFDASIEIRSIVFCTYRLKVREKWESTKVVINI